MPTYTTATSSGYTYAPNTYQVEYVDTYSARIDYLESIINKLTKKVDLIFEAVDDACLSRSWDELEKFLHAYKQDEST